MTGPIERPINIDSESVEKILYGDGINHYRLLKQIQYHSPLEIHGPIQIGDRFWVRESFTLLALLPDMVGAPQIKRGPFISSENAVNAKAEDLIGWQYGAWYKGDPDPGGWAIKIGKISGLRMPRWASRITLEIVAIDLERSSETIEPESTRIRKILNWAITFKNISIK